MHSVKINNLLPLVDTASTQILLFFEDMFLVLRTGFLVFAVLIWLIPENQRMQSVCKYSEKREATQSGAKRIQLKSLIKWTVLQCNYA